MLDLRRLRILLEFAERGSIAATAVALGYTASAISQQLSVLERESGVALLDRTSRSAELTDAGRRLAAHSAEILARVEEAEADLSAQSATPTGRIVITAFPTAAVAFAPALARSLGEHPDLTFVLRQTPVGDGVSLVQSGEADIALIDHWAGVPATSPTLSVVHLRRDPLVLVVPTGHELADPGIPVDLGRLRNEPWLTAPAGEPSRQAVDRLLATVGGTVAVPWEFEGLHTILGLVAQGIGIAVLPELALATGGAGVVVREIPAPTPTRDVYAVIRTASARRPSVAVTLRAIRTAAGTSDR
ncbi:LysR family transcriptional regulator [Pseudonocardiaceae bacterium YIM PH 21723]|nr:LysR family transcriptional regulator [Pseudonocardiaceae bacterium YIM PH 21723]